MGRSSVENLKDELQQNTKFNDATDKILATVR
jgi:hypothetical protein